MKLSVAVLWVGTMVCALAAVPAARAVDLQLTGKTALITGSTSGIGYSTAKMLLREGAQVIINGRTQASVDRAAASLKAATGKAPLVFAGDMGKAEDISRLAQTYPHVDILINNVGARFPNTFEKATDQEWHDAFELNVLSGVRLSRDYIPGMKAQKWGRIIFIASNAALEIPLQGIVYGVSKATDIAVARGIAESVANTGITVNSILPGPTLDQDDPRMADRLKQSGAQSFAELQDNYFKAMGLTSLIQRFSSPDEVAALIVYVASPLSSATTGTALRVDGGVASSAY
jgi:NAD(P)-dependent dehydrogenase (short-subunit alcohol dehydrogenase family)